MNEEEKNSIYEETKLNLAEERENIPQVEEDRKSEQVNEET